MIKDLDKTDLSIVSSYWRGICFGLKEDGTPYGSNETWSKFRSQVGLVDVKGKPTFSRKISQYHAMLLLIRSKIKEICYDLGEQCDVTLDPFELAKLGDRWIAHTKQTSIVGMVQRLAQLDNLAGYQLEEVLKIHAGKSLSLSTIRRKCNQPGVPKFRKKAVYTANQVRIMIRAVTA